MFPALLRPGGTRRGEVILSQDEAWNLMATSGPQLEAAGLRRARSRAVAPQAHSVVARVRRCRAGNGRRRESARQRALVGGLRRRRAHRGRHRAPRARGPSTHPFGWALGRARQGRPPGRGRRARGTGRHHAALGRGNVAARARHRGFGPGRRRFGGRWWLGGRPARGRGRSVVVARRCTRGFRRRVAQLSGRSARRGWASSTAAVWAVVSRSTWASARRRRCWPTCSRVPATVPPW